MKPWNDDAFQAWKAEADTVGVEQAWALCGSPTKLRRAGRDLVGPCPACGGNDRFGINASKNKFICRGSDAGGPVGMVMHVLGYSWQDAMELLAGRPKPGHRHELTEQEKKERDERLHLLKSEAAKKDAERERDREQDEKRRRENASFIWAEAQPIPGTMSEDYLVGRGLDPRGFRNEHRLRHHRGLPHPDGSSHPCLVALVSDFNGKPSGIWRIYLGDGPKGRAKVSNAKLGLGSVAGGAVRLGGVAPRIGAAEGIETALAAAELDGWKHPVWATLSTSGMRGFLVPKTIIEGWIYPDFDLPKIAADGRELPPPGITAARDLHERIGWKIIDRPPGDSADWIDVLRDIKGLPHE